MTINPQDLRNTLGLFVTGVTVITTQAPDGERVGITANSFNSVSLDPPLVLWSIAKTSRSLAAFEAASNFAVHILRDDQTALSQRFATPGKDKFAMLETSFGLGDIPILPTCAALLECSIYGRHPAGDHVVYIARVERMQSDPTAKPLVYHGGRYATLADQTG